jgi:sugar lactone lactonase YvrE
MRRSISAVFAALLPGAAAAGAADWAEVVARVQAAHRAGDLVALEAALHEADALRPGYPRVIYNLAETHARRGEPDTALAALERLAAMGIVMPAEQDEDFAPLRAEPRWAALLARFAANLEPRAGGRPLFELGDPRFVPEGLAVDRRHRVHYVGSVTQRRIVRVARDGIAIDFVTTGRDGLMSVLGLALDTRRRLLWANSSALPEMQGYTAAEAGRAALYAFALESGRLVHRFELPADGTPRMLGDLALGPEGVLYASDPLGGAVFALDPREGLFRRLTAPGALASPQGIAVAPDGRALLVADYAQGLMRVALADGAIMRLPQPGDLCAFGIDGLARYGRSLIAVQNGVRPHRILRLALDARGTRIRDWRTLAVADRRWSEPTLGVVVGDHFRYVANSQWDRFDDAHRLREDPPLSPPLILELPLRVR